MKLAWSELLEDLQNRGISDSSSSSDAEYPEQLARFHGVFPQIDRVELEGIRQQNQVLALRNLRHLRTLLDAFAVAEIPVLLVKGIALALRLYGDVGARRAGDIDLWIPEERLNSVHDLLIESGHVAKTGYAVLSPHYQKLYRKRKFHIGYTHRKTGISVEVHWRLGGTHPLFPVPFREAFDRKHLLSTGNVDIPTLGDLDHLLFLHCHAARHLWERLFWLVDLVDFHQVPEGPLPGELLERARDLGIERAVLASWRLAEEFLQFDPGIDESFDETGVTWLVNKGRKKLLLSDGNWNSFEGLISSLLLHRSFSHKGQVLLEQLTAADDWHRVRLPPGFSWVYALLRPWFWLERKRATSP